MCSTSHQVLQAGHNPDSENVNRLWSDRPQPSGDANIIRCLWCFTLLMNLHDFGTENFNPVHSFHNAHTVPFCLTADHSATCHMSLCPHQASTVLVCFWTCVVWKVFGTCDDGIWSYSWSPTRVLVRGHSSGLVGWSRTRGVPRESRSSEESVLISRRLRRMVGEVFGKHFGGLYSWSTMSSSFVSPCVALLSHCESFSLFMHLHGSSSLSCHICLLRLVSSTCHPSLLDR